MYLLLCSLDLNADILQDWSERVSLGHIHKNMDGYQEKFEKMQAYFAPRFAEATKVGNEMIKTIEENLNSRKVP
jgi:prephenate dehydrogenase (NADP+)